MYGRMWHITSAVPADMCPNGWHVPVWNEIQQYFPNNSTVNDMKATTSWTGTAGCGDGPGNDKYGFTALGTGFRDDLQANVSDYKMEGLNTYFALEDIGDCLVLGWRCEQWATYEPGNDDWNYIRCIR